MGFFKTEEILEEEVEKHTTADSIKRMLPRKPACSKCNLYKGCKSPSMPTGGHGQKRILVIAEAPGKDEDEKGTQLVGQAGKKLREELKPLGIELNHDCWKENALACRPPGNRIPSSSEITFCRPRLYHVIKELKPEKVFLFGSIATKAFLDHRIASGRFDRWTGYKIPDQEVKAWIYPMYHPSYLLRNEGNVALEKLFRQQLKEAVEHKEVLPSWGDESKKVTLLFAPTEAQRKIQEIHNQRPQQIAVDFETTGLKPYRKGHRIVYVAISPSPNEAFAFPLQNDELLLKELRSLLHDVSIKKIAQNIKFECIWSSHVLKCSMQGLFWDTMLAAHVLDNRREVTGLKFQTYVNYGLADYGKDIDPYIHSSGGGNGFNRIDDFSIKRALIYNGIDAMMAHRLSIDQRNLFGLKKNANLIKGYNLLFRSTLALVEVETAGIHIDTNYCNHQEQVLQHQTNHIAKKILSSTEALQWRKRTGKLLNPNSDTQLNKLLFDVLNYDTAKSTVGGKASVDLSVLSKIGTPFTKDVITLRKTGKISSYLQQFTREAVDGYMHPSFNLNIPTTYRSSSNNPNFQNIPQRDEGAQKTIRQAIIPRPGRQILGVDYSSIEVRVGACYHHDPVMIKYIKDINTDMHRDQAAEIFSVDTKDVSKQMRFMAKNCFVFPQFYGDYYVNCAQDLWKGINTVTLPDGTPIREHLKQKEKIRTYQQFEKHIEKIEKHFWKEKFSVYDEWRENMWENYQQNGYIEMFTGFRCSGLMKRNDVINYPIQGTAAHLLFWSLIQLVIKTIKNGFDSYIIGPIHDELVWDVVPDELQELKKLIRKIMCTDIRKHWSWIIVPIEIEANITEVDGNWYEKRKEEI